MEFERGKEADASQDKLDVEYRQILRIIKPYIQTINNNVYLAQYRTWLEKLSETKDDEKFVRNQYLMELARQIQCKHLASPFTQGPPMGNLPPLRGQPWSFEEPFSNPYDDQLEDSEAYLNKQRMCQQWTEDNESNKVAATRPQWPYHMPMPRPRRPSTNQQLLAAQRCVQRSATSVKKMNLLKEIDEQCGDKFPEDSESGATTPRSPARPPRPALPSSPRAVPTSPAVTGDARLDFDPKKRHHQAPLGVIHEDNADTRESTSWDNLTDVSDASLAVMGCGDSDNKREQKRRGNEQGDNFEKKINTLMVEINGLKRKSEKVNERCEHTIRTVQEQLPPNRPHSLPEDTKVRNSVDENVSALKRITITADVKEATTEQNGGSFITTDWKKIVESLQVRLSETQNQNRELNALTSTLHKKIKEMDATKEQAKQEIKKQILEQHKKEIESLKSEHQKYAQEVESSREAKIKKMEETMEKRVIEEEQKYENKLSDIKGKYEKELKDKDLEIRRLEEIIQKECMRLINEITVLRSQIEEASHTNSNNDDRILFLQKCITKMDRLFQKSEREYCKKIEKLKQDLDNRNKAVQIQLQTQKAEVISRCSAEKQRELDAIVRTLEDKYTALLEMQQVQISRIRNEDEKIIAGLRSILDQHNISYPY